MAQNLAVNVAPLKTTTKVATDSNTSNTNKPFSYNLPMSSSSNPNNKENESSNTNLPLSQPAIVKQPQFVSKYAQQLYMQAHEG